MAKGKNKGGAGYTGHTSKNRVRPKGDGTSNRHGQDQGGESHRRRTQKNKGRIGFWGV